MRNTLRSFIALALLTFAVGPSVLRSQDAAPAPAITYSGFFDAYYIKNLASPVTGKNNIRVFDPVDNEFNLALAEVSILKKGETVSFRVDLGAGKVTGLSLTGLVQQAYATAVIPVGSGLTVDVGQFVTHMGYEVIESKDNWNYSRSILFGWAIPFYHTGARFSYPVLSNLTATLHVLNGWNLVTDNNNYKTLGLTLNYALAPSTSIILNALSGTEATAPIYGKRNVYDLIITHQLTEALALALNADYGEERLAAGLATWKGGAVYAKYAFDEKSAAALRFEMYNDASNASPTGSGGGKLSEITATYEYKPVSDLILRGEIRSDMSDVTYFDSKKPADTKSQLTATVGAIITF
ncbi:MAG: porin [Bacteroidota bacterium]